MVPSGPGFTPNVTRLPGQHHHLAGHHGQCAPRRAPHRPPRPGARWHRAGGRARRARARRRSRPGERSLPGERIRDGRCRRRRSRCGAASAIWASAGGRRQLEVAEVVDPQDLGPHAAAPIAPSAPARPPRRGGGPTTAGRSGRPTPRVPPRRTEPPRRGRRGRARRSCGRGRRPRRGDGARTPGRSAPLRPVPLPRSRSPLSGPTKKVGPFPAASPARTGRAASEPTPGSTTARTTPGPRCGEARTSVWEPARTSNAGT